MEKQYISKKTEEKIYQFWQQGNFFNPDKFSTKSKKHFSITIPPPNITGTLHIGHALNITIQDILIRWKRMQGIKTIWIPGTDHASIATQNVVEKELKKQGKNRFDLGKKKFIKKTWQWKEKYGNIILEQIKKMGASCDWSKTRFTMDPGYIKSVETAFLHYFKKGLVYRGERVINWCPRCKTGLSDLELEHEEEKSNLWFIKYGLVENKKKFIVVATTRPETMLGDTAVAVNPKDKKYSNIIGKKVILPIINKEIPIIADNLVDSDFGTGAVKVTPAHSLIDWEIGKKHNLEAISVINENREINKNGPVDYQGLKTTEAREKIIQILSKQGLIEKIQDYTHSVPKCYRCGSTIELLLSKQWFLKMKNLAELAVKAVKNKEIKFHPKRWEKVYFNWLKNTHDWCISRQIWWGQRLPVWFCQKNKEKYFVSIKPPKQCLICKKCKPKQSEDVFDTWFSSALWPFAVFGWPKKTKEFKAYYPTNVIITARDIINIWVGKMIFSAQELTKKIPFQDVIIHATVLTKKGKRMSKSLGTGINPLNLVENYGADAVRFGLAWQISDLQDIKFDESNIIAGKKFSNKIWNAARFVMHQIGDNKILIPRAPKPITKDDKIILNKLEKTTKSVNKNLDKFYFGKAAQEIYNFFWHEFCDVYIEKAKLQIKNAENKKQEMNTKIILIYALVNSLKILHPFIPFITEEIYQILNFKNKKKAIIIEKWPCSK